MLPVARGSARVDLSEHLLSLLGEITAAVGAGRLIAALRLADRAVRVVPHDPTIKLLHARLLMRNGCVAEAEARLRDGKEPEALASRAEALWKLGRMEQASELCSGLLRRYAVDGASYLPPLAAKLCLASGARPCGWIGLDSRLRVVGEALPDQPVTLVLGTEEVRPRLARRSAHGLAPFLLELSRPLTTSVKAGQGGQELLGSELSWPPPFEPSGWVLLEDQTLQGEARLGWAPSLPITLVVEGDHGDPTIVSVPQTSAMGSQFTLDRSHWGPANTQLHVSMLLPDGERFPLTGSPVSLQPDTQATPIHAWSTPRAVVSSAKVYGTVQKGSGKIDVIIPAYIGYQETLSCLQSVLATVSRQDVDIIVVDDASPDAELRAALADYARRGSITLLSNPDNLGFPGAVNRGMQLHPERDVVLLNSDTEVYGSWLERLQAAACAAADIGTVTPLGESASITTYPAGADRGYTSEEAEAIDRVASHINANTTVEIPVGVGFCLYIRRACLAETGYFDESAFARGYGEENDFCLRARRHGWRHLAAPNVYVRHRGAQSYGSLRHILMARNQRVLNARYPGYDQLVADFISCDPLRASRRAIDSQRLLSCASSPVLILTLALPGGVGRHVEMRRAALQSSGHTVVILQPADIEEDCSRVCLRVPALQLQDLVYELPAETGSLHSLLGDLRLSFIEIHHFLGIAPQALRLVAALGVEYDIFVHDYSWVCPRVTLLGGNQSYCGEPALQDCEDCARSHGSVISGIASVQELRERSATWLRGARRVLAPTHDVAARLGRHFPDQAVEVVPWDQATWGLRCGAAGETESVRIAVLGAISSQKGYHILLACARDAFERNLPLEFIVIGYTRDDAALLASGRVFITGPYKEPELGMLLDRERCHAALVPSVTPETWCYTVSHTLEAGLPALAFDCGAQAERLRGLPYSVLLPLGAPAAEINDELIQLGRRTRNNF